MARETIAEFMEATMTEKALADKVVALAVEHGYDFTAEEFLELGAACPLSDDDAEKAVAAGGGLPGVFNPKHIESPVRK